MGDICRATVTLALTLGLMGCDKGPSQLGRAGRQPSSVTNDLSTSAGDRVVARVAETWERRLAHPETPPAALEDERIRLLSGIVNDLSEEEEALLRARLTEQAPMPEAPILPYLAEVLIRKYRTEGDRAKLIQLIGGRPIRDVHYGLNLVCALVVMESDLKDPVLILCDAYRASSREDARAVLVDNLATAFPGIRAMISDDDAFIDECSQWYLANKERLVVRREEYYREARRGFSHGPVELYAIENSAGAMRHDASWVAAEELVSNVKKAWDDRKKDIHGDGKDAAEAEEMALESIVAALNPREEKMLFDRLTRDPTEHRQPLFPYLEQAFIHKYRREANRERLVELLAARPIRAVDYYVDTVCALVLTPSNLQDPILILTDAYKKAKGERPRAALLDALASAFPGIRQRVPDDDAFVDECAKWYLDNKDELHINEDEYYRGAMEVFALGHVELFYLDDNVPVKVYTN